MTPSKQTVVDGRRLTGTVRGRGGGIAIASVLCCLLFGLRCLAFPADDPWGPGYGIEG